MIKQKLCDKCFTALEWDWDCNTGRYWIKCTQCKRFDALTDSEFDNLKSLKLIEKQTPQ